jgi:LuxR family transcriptional regulator, maltose regulon positive regulatory protein
MASLEQAGYHSDVLGGSIVLADMRLAQGRLREAMGIFERGLQRAEQSQPVLRGDAAMHVGLSQLFRERDDLNGARQHLQASTELSERAGLLQNPYRWRVAIVRIREAEGDLVGALGLLDEAERLYVGDFSPDGTPSGRTPRASTSSSASTTAGRPSAWPTSST